MMARLQPVTNPKQKTVMMIGVNGDQVAKGRRTRKKTSRMPLTIGKSTGIGRRSSPRRRDWKQRLLFEGRG